MGQKCTIVIKKSFKKEKRPEHNNTTKAQETIHDVTHTFIR